MKIRKHEDRERKRFKRWKDKNGEWKRVGKKVRHHMVNRCNGGQDSVSNLLLLDESREKAWHFLFQNMSFEEVVELLSRVLKAKQRQEIYEKVLERAS